MVLRDASLPRSASPSDKSLLNSLDNVSRTRHGRTVRDTPRRFAKCGKHNKGSREFRHVRRIKADNNNNNNKNTVWRGSVSTGEEPPPHSWELKHALSQAGGPTQSQLSRPMSSGHHISMEHRLRRKQLNSDTHASKKNI